MIYKIISPFNYSIDGSTHIDAIKKFIKLNHDLNINKMIIEDRQKYYQANINYYNNNLGRRKVGIDTFPSNYIPIINSRSPFETFIKISNDKSDDDKKDNETIEKKIVVPMHMPYIEGQGNYPFRMPNYIPTVVTVSKNKEDDSDKKKENDEPNIKFIIPLQPRY